MKTILTLALLCVFFTVESFGQAAGAIRRARETVNQNNVRQEVPPPAQAVPRPVVPPQTGTNAPVVTQAASIARLTGDIAGIKANTPATAGQKQRFIINLAQSARGKKPTLGTVKKFVDSATDALSAATLTPEQQSRLATDIEAVFNGKDLSLSQFEKTIEDTQAILMVGTVKRAAAVSVAADLKAVGAEIRR